MIFLGFGTFIFYVGLFLIDGVFVSLPIIKYIWFIAPAILLSLHAIIRFFTLDENEYNYNLFSNNTLL